MTSRFKEILTWVGKPEPKAFWHKSNFTVSPEKKIQWLILTAIKLYIFAFIDFRTHLAALSSLIAPVAVRMAQSPQTMRMVSRIGKSLNTPIRIVFNLLSLKREKVKVMSMVNRIGNSLKTPTQKVFNLLSLQWEKVKVMRMVSRIRNSLKTSIRLVFNIPSLQWEKVIVMRLVSSFGNSLNTPIQIVANTVSRMWESESESDEDGE